MLSENTCLSLAVLVVVLCQVQSLEPSLHNNKAPVDGLKDETRCSWNCAVMDSVFMEEINTTIATKKAIGNTFAFEKYEKKATEKCGSQTSRSSSGNKQLSVFAKALESALKLTSCTDSIEEHKQIMAICTLTPISTDVAVPTYYSGSSPKFFLVRLADLGVKLDSIDCNEQTTDNLQPCIKITKSTGNNSNTFEGLPKCGSWPVDVLHCLCLVFFIVLLYYSPVFLCLFAPTEVVEDGVYEIVLDRASPVSLGSLIGNYFFSKEDTIWHRAKMFILRAVVLPFPFLGLAIFAEHLQYNIFGVSRLLQPLFIVSYVCYFILAFYTSFRPVQPSKRNRSCFFCRRVKSKTLICQENLPKTIINHLRIQPQLIAHCWRLFIRNLLNYFKRCFLLIPSVFEVSAILCPRLFLFIVLLSVSPAITIILLTFMLLQALFAILLTSPLAVLCDISRVFNAVHFHNRCLRFSSCFIVLSVAIPVLLGSCWLMTFASFGGLITFLSVFVLLLSEEGLPYVACSVLVFYYLWSSYSSFTDKYQYVALELFKHYKSYKRSERSQVTDITLNTDSLLKNTQNVNDNKDSVLKIPQKLFSMACEQLMPKSRSVCLLILKIITLVSFVLLVFSVAMSRNEGATPVIRTLIAFLTGSFPKIVASYLNGGNQKKIKAMIAEERIPVIVLEYVEGISAANQQQVNSGSNVDAAANQRQVNSGSDIGAAANQQQVNSGSDIAYPAIQQQVNSDSEVDV